MRLGNRFGTQLIAEAECSGFGEGRNVGPRTPSASTHADWCPARAREPGHSRLSRSWRSPHGLYRAQPRSARWGPTKTSNAQAGDRSQVPLGSKLGDGFASRCGGVLSEIAHVENVSEHEQRVGVVGDVVGGLHELERAPRGGLRLDRGPTEQVRPREQQLASDEGTPISERDGRLERIGEPEELARPILRSDRLAQEFVDQDDPPDLAERREELPRIPEPPLGCLCLTHGYLDEGDPQTMGSCEPCQPVAVENVLPSFLVLVEPEIVTHREGGRRHQGVGDAAGYRIAE